MDLLEAIAANNPELLLDRSRQLMERGREPLTILQNLAGFYRDLLIAKTASNRSDLVACTPATWQQLCEAALHWDVDKILAGQEHLRAGETQVRNTTVPHLWLEVTLVGLLSAVSKTPTPISNSAAVVKPSSQAMSEAADVWMQSLKQLPLSTKALLQQHGKLVALEDETATVKISSEALKNKVPVERLEMALSNTVGASTRLQLIC